MIRREGARLLLTLALALNRACAGLLALAERLYPTPPPADPVPRLKPEQFSAFVVAAKRTAALTPGGLLQHRGERA